MQSNNRLFRAALFCLLCVTMLPRVVAESEDSSWSALPEETMVAVRIPDGEAFTEALKGTKFGAVMLSEKRKQAVIDVLESDAPDALEDFQSQLKEYGLTTEDLFSLFAGETGYALVLSPPEEKGKAPTPTGLAWLEPGDELAGKVLEVLGKVIDEQDEENAVIRNDITVADHPVMQLLLPSTKTIYTEKFDYDYGEDYDEDAWKKAYQKYQDSAVEKTVYSSLFVAAVGDQILLAHGFNSLEEEAANTAAEDISALLAQWLETQSAGSGGFVSRLTQEAGAAQVMALDGLPVFELLGDVAPLLKMMSEADMPNETPKKVLKMLGVENVSTFAVRSTVQGALWKTQASVAVPAPRQGMMRLLDQELHAIDPPQWVPANVVSYTQFSFDLGEAYEIIKEEVTLAFPESGAGGFAMAEIQVQNFAKASLPELLSSLGNSHKYLSYGLDKASEGEDAGEVTQRVAMVWQIEDEDIWTNLLKAITPFVSMAPGTEFMEEQGFNGYRMVNEGQEGGLFLGKGYLVLGIGTDVTESTLSSLSNPLAGDDAFRGSEVFAWADEIIDLKPALAAQITDGDRYLGMMFKVIRQQFKMIEEMQGEFEGDDEDGSKTFFNLINAILPTDAEAKGMFGVIVNRLEVNEHGIFSENVQEMPAP